MRLVVQIPALNEEKTIADVIGRIPRDIPGITDTQVVVIDDGSSDRTGELARGAGAIVVRHEQKRGVGGAFRSGVQKSTELNADIIVTIDADGQFNPLDISKVIGPIIEGDADFVTASRFMDPELVPEMPKTKRWGNDFMARWISRLVKKKFYDVSCGFRAYSKNAYMRLVLLGEFTYTHETFICLAFARVPIKEVPVKVRGVREHGKSRVANNLFKYGWRTASIILKTYRDYRPLRFFTYFAAALMLLALGFGSFLFQHWLKTGGFFPHKWAGFVAAAFAFTSITLYLAGVVAEMLDRIRVAGDEALFRIRRLEATMTEKANEEKKSLE